MQKESTRLFFFNTLIFFIVPYPQKNINLKFLLTGLTYIMQIIFFILNVILTKLVSIRILIINKEIQDAIIF